MPIHSDTLEGTVAQCVDMEIKFPIDKGVYSEILFNVKANNCSTNFGRFLMELYVV